MIYPYLRSPLYSHLRHALVREQEAEYVFFRHHAHNRVRPHVRIIRAAYAPHRAHRWQDVVAGWTIIALIVWALA